MAIDKNQAKKLFDLSILTYLVLTAIGYLFYHQFLDRNLQNFFPIAFLLFMMVLTYGYRNKLDQKISKYDLTNVLMSYIVIVIIAMVFTLFVILVYPIS